MELDDVKGSMDYRDDQKTDSDIKIDNLADNGEGISFDDGMDVDSVFANYEDPGCAYLENGLKPNAVLVDDQSSEAILDNGSGKESIAAVEVLKSVEGSTDGEPNLSCVDEFVGPVVGENKDVDVPVASMNNASAKEDQTAGHSGRVTNARFGTESGGDINEMHDMSLFVQETNISDASISSSMIENSDAAPVPREDTNESSPTQQVESLNAAVCTRQVQLPEEQVNEDPVSDIANPQSIDVGYTRNESTPIQQVKSPETAISTQQVELPEERLIEDTVSNSENSQYIDEDNVRNEYTPGQPAESPEIAVLVQPVDLPDTAAPTQPVELPEPQEEGPVFDSEIPQSMDEDNTRNEYVSIQQVSLPEAAVSSQQQVELPRNQEVDEDTFLHSEDPQSMDEDDAGNGSMPTQQVESPETAVSTEQVEFPEEQEIDEGPIPDSANPQSKFEKHATSVCAVVSTQHVELVEAKEVDEDSVSDSAKPQIKVERRGRPRSAKPGGSVSNHRVTYMLPFEDDGEFSVFDLVWGKVKSHPWWPGQIFHPSDSSEKAIKHYKKDCYLVAYFGDRSFAWNDASVLKPFKKHFSQEEKQSTSESFQNAVKCALSEVSRRVELGMACSCISEAAYDKIKHQIVENGGIREESSKREGIDSSSGPETFHSDKLVKYVRALATSPTSGADRLDLVIAKAQLLAFNRLKGCDALAEFNYYCGLDEFDANSLLSGEKGTLGDSEVGDRDAKPKGHRKRKHNLKDIVYERRKEKSLTELMGESIYCLDGEFDSHEEDEIALTSPRFGSKCKTAPLSTKSISFAKVSNTVSSNPQQSFKVGDCIRRVASQLTGSSSIIKNTSDGSESKVIEDDVDEVIDAPDDSVTESAVVPQKQSSPEEMMSLLHLSALNPMNGYNFLGDVISFFYEFRNAAVTTRRQKMRKGPGRKRKTSSPAVGSPEPFEFDDKNDSYWTDMVVQNDSEAKPPRRGHKRKENQLVAADSEKPLQLKRRKYTRKQYIEESHEPSSPEVLARDEKQDQLPTELMLNFGDGGCIPSEVNLNKMFRRFGPLKVSETEIDAQSGRARVVFKKRADAEVAYSSAAVFNVFGSLPVIYQLNYTPSAPFGTSPLALTDTVEHGT